MRKIILKGEKYTFQSGLVVLALETTCSNTKNYFKGVVIKEDKNPEDRIGDIRMLNIHDSKEYKED